MEKVFELFPRLKERQRHWGNELSGGEQQMLAIGRALRTNPRLLLMDEPTEGLAPLLVEIVSDTILHLKEEKNTILLVEQNVHHALRIADRACVIKTGHITKIGSGRELLSDPGIRKAYMGTLH